MDRSLLNGMPSIQMIVRHRWSHWLRRDLGPAGLRLFGKVPISTYLIEGKYCMHQFPLHRCAEEPYFNGRIFNSNACRKNAEVARALAARGRGYFDEYKASGRAVEARVFRQTPDFDEASIIMACIDNGIIFRRPLIEAAVKAGRMSGRKIGRVLDQFNGHNPARHFWHTVRVTPDLNAYKLHHHR